MHFEQNYFLMSILDNVHDNVYTKLGKIPSILLQDIAQKPISDVNQGP